MEWFEGSNRIDLIFMSQITRSSNSRPFDGLVGTAYDLFQKKSQEEHPHGNAHPLVNALLMLVTNFEKFFICSRKVAHTCELLAVLVRCPTSINIPDH